MGTEYKCLVFVETFGYLIVHAPAIGEISVGTHMTLNQRPIFPGIALFGVFYVKN